MFVEKYLIIGIKKPQPVVIGLTKENSYSNNLISPIQVINGSTRDIFIDFGSYDTKNDAYNRLAEIYKNVEHIDCWSILPVTEDVSIVAARKLKLLRLNKKLKRK